MGSDKEELRVKAMTLYLPPILSADSARTLNQLQGFFDWISFCNEPTRIKGGQDWNFELFSHKEWCLKNVSQEFYPEIPNIDGFTGDFFANGPNKLNCDFICLKTFVCHVKTPNRGSFLTSRKDKMSCSRLGQPRAKAPLRPGSFRRFKSQVFFS
jgi:hypothetical protein